MYSYLMLIKGPLIVTDNLKVISVTTNLITHEAVNFHPATIPIIERNYTRRCLLCQWLVIHVTICIHTPVK
jgi:hypothetical protein